MKKNARIGSEPSKIHWGGAAKNPPAVPDTKATKTADPHHISRGAQESNLRSGKQKK